MKMWMLTLSAVLLSACSILPASKTVQVYQLPPGSLPLTPSAQHLALSIAIPRPYVNRFLNHPRLVVRRSGYELQVYAGVQWSDELPMVLRDRLVDDLRRYGLYRSVVTDDKLIDVERSLRLDIQHFELVQQAQTYWVQVAFNAQLVNNQRTRMMASQNFMATVPVENAQLDSIMPAFAQATQEVSQALLAWLLSQETTR